MTYDYVYMYKSFYDNCIVAVYINLIYNKSIAPSVQTIHVYVVGMKGK